MNQMKVNSIILMSASAVLSHSLHTFLMILNRSREDPFRYGSWPPEEPKEKPAQVTRAHVARDVETGLAKVFAPTSSPQSIEDFVWNAHSALASTSLPVHALHFVISGNSS